MRQTTEPIHATREREREIGLIFLRAKQTRTQSGGAKQHAGTAIDSALSNGREKEEECGTCCRREGGRGKTPLGDHFQHLVSTVTRARLSLALDFAPGRCVASIHTRRLSFLKIPPPPPWPPSLAKREIWVLCDASNATLTASSAPVPPARTRAQSIFSRWHRHHPFLFPPSMLPVGQNRDRVLAHSQGAILPPAPLQKPVAGAETGESCRTPRITPTGRWWSRSHLFCLLSEPRTRL